MQPLHPTSVSWLVHTHVWLHHNKHIMLERTRCGMKITWEGLKLMQSTPVGHCIKVKYWHLFLNNCYLVKVCNVSYVKADGRYVHSRCMMLWCGSCHTGWHLRVCNRFVWRSIFNKNLLFTQIPGDSARLSMNPHELSSCECCACSPPQNIPQWFQAFTYFFAESRTNYAIRSWANRYKLALSSAPNRSNRLLSEKNFNESS